MVNCLIKTDHLWTARYASRWQILTKIVLPLAVRARNGSEATCDKPFGHSLKLTCQMRPLELQYRALAHLCLVLGVWDTEDYFQVGPTKLLIYLKWPQQVAIISVLSVWGAGRAQRP
jgi:hypothetical protein